MFAQVIPAKRGLARLPFFEYSVPPELEKNISVGQLVKIPLRSKYELGVVRSLHATMESTRVKSIEEIINPTPFFSPYQLAYLEDLSILYRTSLGFLVKNNLPEFGKRRLESFKQITLSPFTLYPSPPAKPKITTYANTEEKKSFFNQLLAKPGQTLIIVPEIPDIEALKKLLPENLEKIICVTSDLSVKAIYEAMLDIRIDEKKIIIGTHRAFFLPFFDLQTIVIDDDSSPSHKSWDMAPRFHNRDAALILAKHHGARLHITAHTLSVETYYFAKNEIYELSGDIIPPLRPETTIVNMADERRGGNYSIISEELAEAIKKTTQSIFLFINRRGTLNYVACRDCGEVLNCPTCHRSLTYHQPTSTLECHYCRYKRAMVASCPKCHGTNIAMYGAGIEMVEQEIKKLFPDDKREIIRIEQDEKNLKRVDASRAQIIIGTQIAWHHLDWSNFELVALVDTDTSLFVPEFKMVENTWHLIRDAIYRTPPTAPLLIQTGHPEHIIFQAIPQPELFYTQELAQRKMFGYPPYNFLLKIFSGHSSEQLIKQQAEHLYRLFLQLTKNDPDIKITANLEMFPPFYQNKHWQAIIVKLNYKNYKRNIKLLLEKLPEGWKVDLNPSSILSA